MDLPLKAGGGLAHRVVHIVQGQIAVTDEPDIIYTAIIGSCVVVCLYDPISKRGGMAHFLFPDGEAYGASETRFGHQALTELITQIVGPGEDTKQLQASLYGGAKVHDGRRDIGKRNAEFATRFLGQQSIRVVGHGLFGDRVRRVNFSPFRGTFVETFLSSGKSEESAEADAETTDA